MNARALTIMILAVAVTALTATVALAQSAQVIVTPKASYRISYDDNVNNTKKGDIEHRLTPALQVDVNTERSKNTLKAIVGIYRYGDLDNLDRTTQKYSLSSRNDLTERVRLHLNTSYDDDYTISNIAEEQAQIASKTARRRLSLSPRLEFVVTERNLFGLSYSYGSTDYDRDTYVDYDNQSVSADWTYIWTERFRVRASAGTSWYDNRYNNGDGTYSDLTFMAGFDYDIDEIWTWSFMGGLLQSKTTVDRTGQDTDTEGDGYVGSTRLAWNYPRSDGYVEYARDNTIGLSGETLTRDRFRLNERYLLTERSRLKFTALYTMAESDNSLSTETDSSYAQGQLSYEYDLDEDWTWEVGGSHEFFENHVNSNTYDRNKVFMEIRWDLPQEW
ncbi:MAG: hypothetical protein AB7E32_02780 [Desulfovibrio sp.]